DLATEEQVQGYLDQADELYSRIVDHARRNPDALHHGLYARSGLAAVAITRREPDRARDILNELIEEARANQLGDLVRWSERRLARIDEIMAQPPLYNEDDIFAAWGDPVTDAEATPEIESIFPPDTQSAPPVPGGDESSEPAEATPPTGP